MAMFSEVDEIQLNGDQYGGLTKISQLVTKLNNLEYRILPFSCSKKWGASAFLAAGQVYGTQNTFAWDAMLPTAGAGLRYLIFPEKDIYTRIDLAFTREGSGVYFFIGEAF